MGINTNQALEEVATRVDLDFCLVAMPYTLLDQESLTRGMKTCLDRGVSVIIGAPFARAFSSPARVPAPAYAYGKAPPEAQARVQGIEAACKAHNVSMPVAALQFVLAHPAVVATIPGAAKPSEVQANVKALASAESRRPSGPTSRRKGLIHPGRAGARMIDGRPPDHRLAASARTSAASTCCAMSIST